MNKKEKMKLTQESINNINLFENLTRAKVKDCLQENDRLMFLVEETDIGKAVGKNGSNVKRISQVLKKDIRIVAFSSDVSKFVSNLIYPNKADEILVEGNIVTIKVEDNVVKGKIFGRSRENLKRINSIVKNYFDIKEVKVA